MYVSIFISTVIKGILIYVLSLFLSKLIGIKIISQMNFFDFVMGVSVGSMIAKIIIDKEHVVFSGLIALLVFTALTIATSYINLKSYKVRRLINARPLIVVDKSRIINKNMKKLRLTLNELMMKLREKDVFNLEDVEFAIMEKSGQLSVMLKADKKPLTPKDMKIDVESSSIVTEVIYDGNVLYKNLSITGVDINWLESSLKKKGIKNIEDVFFASIDKNKKLIVSEKFNEDYQIEDQYRIE